MILQSLNLSQCTYVYFIYDYYDYETWTVFGNIRIVPLWIDFGLWWIRRRNTAKYRLISCCLENLFSELSLVLVLYTLLHSSALHTFNVQRKSWVISFLFSTFCGSKRATFSLMGFDEYLLQAWTMDKALNQNITNCSPLQRFYFNFLTLGVIELDYWPRWSRFLNRLLVQFLKFLFNLEIFN